MKVQNSLDAKATSIAVRVDLEDFVIQVVDNGHGLTKDQLDLIGIRYMTSKCHTLKDLKSNIKYYGFRGESLASLRECCSALMIVSKAKDCDQTYSKVFRGTRESHGATVSTHNRLCVGTTVIVKEFLITMPVRRARIQPAIEMEEIRHALLALSIIHYKVSFTLRNDTNKVVILQTHEYGSTSEALQHHCNLNKDLSLIPVKASLSPIKVLAYISRETDQRNHFQFIYVNKRLIKNKKVYKLVNKALLKSFYLRNTGKEIRVTNNKPKEPSFPVFVISIKCPYSEYDVSSDPRKLTVEFQNWDPVNKCLEKVCMKFVSSEEMLKIATNTDCSKENSPFNEHIMNPHNIRDMEGLPIKSNILLGVPVLRKSYHQQQVVNTKATKSLQIKSNNKHKITVASKLIRHGTNKLDLNIDLSPSLPCKSYMQENKMINNISNRNKSFQGNMKSGLVDKIKLPNKNWVKDGKTTTNNSKESFNTEFVSNSDLENPFPFKAPNQKSFAMKRKWLSEHVVTESESGVSPLKIKPTRDSVSSEIATLRKESILPINCQHFFSEAIRAMSLTRNVLLNYPEVSSFQTPPNSNLKIKVFESITNVSHDLSLKVTTKNTYKCLIQNDGYYFNCSNNTHSTLVITKKGVKGISNSTVRCRINDKPLQNVPEQQVKKISDVPTGSILCKAKSSINFKKNWHIFSPMIKTSNNQCYKPLAIVKTKCQNKILNIKERNILSRKRTVSKIYPNKYSIPQRHNGCDNFKKTHCDLKNEFITNNKYKYKAREMLLNDDETVLKSSPKPLHHINKTKSNNLESTVLTQSNRILKRKYMHSRDDKNNSGKGSLSKCPYWTNINKNTKLDVLQKKGFQNILYKMNGATVKNLKMPDCDVRNHVKKEQQKTNTIKNKTNQLYTVKHDKQLKFNRTPSNNENINCAQLKCDILPVHQNESCHRKYEQTHTKNVTPLSTKRAHFTNQFKCHTKNNKHITLPSQEINSHEIIPINSKVYSNVDKKPKHELKEIINNDSSKVEYQRSNEKGILKSFINEFTKSKINQTPEILRIIGSYDNYMNTSHVDYVPFENNCSKVKINDEEKKQPILNKEIGNQNSDHSNHNTLNNNSINMEHPSLKCIGPSKNDNIWRKEAIPNGKTIYINPLTGMSSYLTPNHEVNEPYVISNRYWFMTKGTSPLLSINNSKCNNVQPTEVEKNIVKQIVEPNLTAELETIKWKDKYQKGDESVLNLLNSNSMDKHWNPRYNFNSSCVFSTESLKTAKVLKQIDNKFIAALLQPNKQTNVFLILFDQHAVDERIRLETLTRGYKNNDGQLISHAVNPNIEVYLTENEQSIVNELRQRISKYGLMFTPDKEKVLVNSVPLCLYNRALRERNEGILAHMVTALLRELISLAEAVRGVMPTMPPSLSDIINSEACRGAIKFGDELTLEKSKLLLSKLSDCETPFQCAHGRPVLTPLIEIKESLTDDKTINLKRLIRREARLKSE